ncbi:MAG: glutamine--tRNA ligase, partial [Luteolibacter sp.]
VSGWDDPRMPTISGMRRRGYPAEAIRSFVVGTGITKYKGITDVAVLENEVRNHLNSSAERRMAVLDPVRVVMENWGEQPMETATVPNHPQNPDMGDRQVPISNEVYIERDDFMEDPPKKFFRLGPERYVRLRGGHIIQCTGFEKDADGQVSVINAKILPDTVGQDAPEGVKCKAAIHWVDAATGLDAEVRIYDRLFTTEDPDGADGGFLSVLNPDSLNTVTAKVEPSLANCAAGFSCQFERTGYFFADPKDHATGKLVFNRTVALRDSWGKRARK